MEGTKPKIPTFRLTPITGEEMIRMPEGTVIVRLLGSTFKLEECDGLRPCDCSLCEEHRS